MNDTTTQTNGTPVDSRKPTVELVTGRRVFATLALAGVALGAIAAASTDFDSIPLVTPGASFDETGAFIPEAPEWTADSHEIMLAPLATKAVKAADGTVTKPAKLIALVFCPIPTVDAASADDAGLLALNEVWRKEMNHRAVRKLRNSENVQAAASEMPLSLESFVTAQDSGPSGLEAFDDHWLTVSQVLAKQVPAWAARFPGGKGKASIRGAVENAAKAAALFGELEAFGKPAQSLFVRLLQTTVKLATKAGQDVTLLDAWLKTRDAQTYDQTAEATDTGSLDGMFDDLLAEPDAPTEGDESEPEGDPPTTDDATAEANEPE